jgi:hypothetical protein
MTQSVPTYKGRSLGILTLTTAQLLIGAIHIFAGLLVLAFENFPSIQPTIIYDFYTLIFGLSVMVFAYYIWQGKRIGWIGTVAVSLFVIVADSLTLLDLPSIPGIPKFAGFGEITYSVFITIYLCSSKLRKKYLV